MFWMVLFGGLAYWATGSWGIAGLFAFFGAVVWALRYYISANTPPGAPFGLGLLY